ncbi:hypothetical protein GOP47_0017210 [Adiantum capillus-veneris]|uniref:Uncharacterized protein n=1 Tax=Adiantum capillus-veneris TaxID=13818 RepID=A0A9D4UJ91_ADICA|nr:hypothetical protein GOP47_0017210 [Adiantum capillus-veneris]
MSKHLSAVKEDDIPLQTTIDKPSFPAGVNAPAAILLNVTRSSVVLCSPSQTAGFPFSLNGATIQPDGIKARCKVGGARQGGGGGGGGEGGARGHKELSGRRLQRSEWTDERHVRVE